MIRLSIVIAIVLGCVSARASVVEYTSKSQWQAAAGAYTTIHFTELPHNTLVTNQYASLGVLFTDGSDYIDWSIPDLFPNDGAGLYGAFNTVSLKFLQPMTSIAIEDTSRAQFDLFRNGELIYQSNVFGYGASGVTNFAGLISTLSFDAVRIYNPFSGELDIDDLYFGPPIPGPGALPLVGLGFIAARSRRRRSRMRTADRKEQTTMIRLSFVIAVVFVCVSASASVVEYTSKSQWQAAAGAYTTIHFTELPHNTFVTNQYAPLGVLFTDGSDIIDTSTPDVYPNDGAGLYAAFNTVSLKFLQPMTSIAIDYPAIAQFDLLRNNQLIFQSSIFGLASPPIGLFAGLISAEPFDTVRIYNPFSGELDIDDLHFGPPIPGPGALPLVGLGFIAARTRRRRCA